jgi:hypothetical protein
MLITDLEHLELIPKDRNSSNCSLIKGQGFNVFAPLVNLRGAVRASSNPSSLVMEFSGNVNAGGYAYLNVSQGGSIYAKSPV